MGGETKKAVHVYSVWGNPSCGADGAIADALDVRELHVPVGAFCVNHHGEHLSHRVIDALSTAVDAGMVETGGDLVIAEALVDGVGYFRAEL